MAKGLPPMFSRSPRHLFGKRTIAKHTKISDETAELLSGLANSANITESDFIARLIEIRCHGLHVVASLQQNSLNVVSGMDTSRSRDREQDGPQAGAGRSK